MAAHHHSLRPPPPPLALRSVTVSVHAPPHPHRCRARPPFASFRPPPPPPRPKKRADHEATAADLGEEVGTVADDEAEAEGEQREYGDAEYAASVGAAASLPARLRAGPGGDPLFYLLAAVAVTTSVAFTGMVAVAIPTMLAMRRAANSFTMLADAALEELPSTMAAVRLSGMEISDLTLELSDLSHEIADGVNKSAKVAQAVEAGIGQMQDIARRQAMSMIEERANLQTIPTAGPVKKSGESSSPPRRQQKGRDV